MKVTCPECGAMAWMPDDPRLGSAIRCEKGHTTRVTEELVSGVRDALQDAAMGRQPG